MPLMARVVGGEYEPTKRPSQSGAEAVRKVLIRM
jgi:hypothetical protein